MQVLVKTLKDDTEFELELELVAGENGLRRKIDHPRVQKPGLALSGFLSSVQPNRVQVIGKTEHGYLASLSSQRRSAAIQGFLSTDLACAIVTTDLAVSDEFLQTADRLAVPIFGTKLASSFLIRRIERFLDWLLSPETSHHGVLIDVFGVGVLLMGQSGIGKSECAMDLILRGHRLVADDVVLIRRQAERLIGMGSPLTRHHMEVRGLGIINVRDLFGAASVRERKRIELVVEMLDWKPGDVFDRTGVDDLSQELIEVLVPKVRLPIRPGRNLASIVEVAARNHLLKLQGHHSAREFQETLEKRLAAAAEEYLATPEVE